MPSIINYNRRVHVHEQPWSILDLVTEFNPKNTGSIIIPEGQRLWAWKDKKGLNKQQKLIDSVFYGFPIPSIILNKKRNSRTLEVYDGRHRIETLWRFYNNQFKWEGHLFSELSVEDQRVFCERTLPATITQNATNEQLADMFIRLNAGVSLKDSDLLWIRRDMSLVKQTLELVCKNERLSTTLGGLDLSRRPDLANWTALTAGLSTRNAGNMTTSFVRLAGDPGLGLEMDVDAAYVRTALNAFCELLEEANTAFPVLQPQQRKLKKVGKVAAFYFSEWMAADDKAPIQAKWLSIVGRLRSGGDVAKAMSAALSTTGAQNLTTTKISETLEQVNAYLAGVAPSPTLDDDDDDDDDSD
jgi:hypothetical protein